jgi:hypothetical protein
MLKRLVWGGLLLLVCLLGIPGVIVYAQGASNGYRIDESFIGPGGRLESGSTNFLLAPGQQSTGNIGVGESGSNNFGVQSGSTTTNDPSLACSVGASNINFGNFSTTVTSTATATFSVLNYTAYGYNVAIIGNTPSNGSHNLTGMNPTAASSTGTEQFGINLVANNAPTTFGANPVQVPDNTFSFGTASANYGTTDNYRYVPGETIATAPRSSGQTDYTISYVVNVSNLTPGGDYTGGQTLVCTGTY